MAETRLTTEQALAAIWNDVLQRSGDIGAADRFFELGGDSVSMMMMLFKVEKGLRVDISPEQIFGDDSFGSMVDAIAAAQPASSGASVAVPQGAE